MKQFPIDIFGSRWVVLIGTRKELTTLSNDNAGEADISIRQIQVLDSSESQGVVGKCADQTECMKGTIRHEIAHAALWECAMCGGRTFDHEQIADWVDMKHHALHAVIVEAERNFDLLMKEGVDAKT